MSLKGHKKSIGESKSNRRSGTPRNQMSLQTAVVVGHGKLSLSCNRPDCYSLVRIRDSSDSLCITLNSYFRSKSTSWLTSLLTLEPSLPSGCCCLYHSAIHEFVGCYADAVAYQILSDFPFHTQIGFCMQDDSCGCGIKKQFIRG